MTDEILDATDQPIKLNGWYGYSTSSNGWATIIIGVVTKIRPEVPETRNEAGWVTKPHKPALATLQVLRRKTFLYRQASNHQKNTAKTVTIAPFHLFPVSI